MRTAVRRDRGRERVFVNNRREKLFLCPVARVFNTLGLFLCAGRAGRDSGSSITKSGST